MEDNSPYKKYFPLPRVFKFIIPGLLLVGIIAAGSFLVSYANKLKSKKKENAKKEVHTKKEKKYNNFRQKIIKDFSDETTMSKVNSTKSTFRKFMDYLENREAERINFAKEIEKRFYQTKLQEFTRSSVKKFIPPIRKTSTLRTLSVTQNDFAKSMNEYEKYERNINKIAGKSLADAIFDMDCPEYEEIKHGKTHKETNGINLNNLERKISNNTTKSNITFNKFGKNQIIFI